MEVKDIVLKANNFEEFNPLQKKCVNKIDKNLVISAPTASGKTLIAELFILDSVLNKGKKVIYTCPLKALASEHYNDLKKKYKNIKFSLSTGDMDSSSSYLKKFDVIFTTFEKLSSLQRHKAKWLEEVGCLIVDEIHELDSDRGPVLEVAITQMKKNIKILSLSATISNAQELAEWLDAELIKSDYRPVKLKQGVEFDDIIEYDDNSIENSNIEDKISSTINDKKQVLLFLNSRKNAESYAKKLLGKTSQILSEKEKIELEKLSNRIRNALEQPTEQCISLAECVKKGICFHHAGLMQKQRSSVEDGFKKGLIKIISATTTLSAGINCPADLVVIPTLYRFSGRAMELIPTREYLQCVGRSGRPKYSKEGNSIINAKSDDQKELFLKKYINGLAEPIYSKLSIVPILRMHLLGLIATNIIYDDKSAWNFFSETLYAKQYSEMMEIYEKVMGIIDELQENGFVEKKQGFFECTPIGKRVSELFLDPESAFSLIEALKSKSEFNELSYLFTWCNCYEFFPLLRIPKRKTNAIWEEFNSHIKELPFDDEKLFFENNSLEVFFSSLAIKDWINEVQEQELIEKFGLSPGVLFGKSKILEWLAYSTIELSKLIDKKEHIINSKKLSLRLKYGVKEELVGLVELKGIGRARARKLFNSGIRTIADVKKNFDKIDKILGKNVSEKLKQQLKYE